MVKDSSSVHAPLDAAAPPPPSSSRGHPGFLQWGLFISVAALVVIGDQITKRLIDAHLGLYESWPAESWPVHFTHAANSGAAFSILQDQTTFLIVTSLIGLAAILLFFFYPPFEHPLLRAALGLQLGGAIGNLLDRVRYGVVTDFI